MSETPRTDELKRGIWRLMQSQEREEAYAWRDAIHCGIEQLERDLAAERERADKAKADGIKEGMRRAAEIAEEHASVEGIAQRIRAAILKEAGE